MAKLLSVRRRLYYLMPFDTSVKQGKGFNIDACLQSI